MTGEEKGEKAVTQSRPPVDARAGIAGIARGDRARHARSSERDEQAAMPTRPNIVVAEQWLCFLLGFICMACGGWGICMKYSLDLSSGYISWLGSAYGPHCGLPQLHALFQEQYSFAVDWLDLTCHRSLAAGMYAICRREQRTQCKENTRSTDELRLWAEVKGRN